MHDLVAAEQKVGGILAEIESAYFDIPFENSEFQTRAFVIASQITPARAYRAIGLQMMSKIQAVKNALFEKQKRAIDVEELEYKINLDATSDFDKRRHRLEIARIRESEAWSQKLLNDALHDLDVLYAEFKKFPAITRAQFEKEEAIHFEHRLNRQLQQNGAQESLTNMKHDIPALGAMLDEIKKLTNQGA